MEMTMECGVKSGNPRKGRDGLDQHDRHQEALRREAVTRIGVAVKTNQVRTAVANAITVVFSTQFKK